MTHTNANATFRRRQIGQGLNQVPPYPKELRRQMVELVRAGQRLGRDCFGRHVGESGWEAAWRERDSLHARAWILGGGAEELRELPHEKAAEPGRLARKVVSRRSGSIFSSWSSKP